MLDVNLERATPPMRFEYQTSPAVLSFPPLDSFQRSFFRMFGKVVIRKYASTHYARVMRESKAISIEEREIERARFFEEGNNSLGLAFLVQRLETGLTADQYVEDDVLVAKWNAVSFRHKLTHRTGWTGITYRCASLLVARA